MRHALRFLLTLFTILCAVTMAEAAARGAQGGMGRRGAGGFAGDLESSAGFLAPGRTVSQIDGKKFDCLFGRATGREHNLARTNQNALEMKRLGVPDTAEGHAMLSSHLDDAVQGNSNISRSFDNEWGSFEVRESLFPGPSGKFSKFESTWQVMPEGSRRFSTLIPRGGGN